MLPLRYPCKSKTTLQSKFQPNRTSGSRDMAIFSKLHRSSFIETSTPTDDLSDLRAKKREGGRPAGRPSMRGCVNSNLWRQKKALSEQKKLIFSITSWSRTLPKLHYLDHTSAYVHAKCHPCNFKSLGVVIFEKPKMPPILYIYRLPFFAFFEASGSCDSRFYSNDDGTCLGI